MARQLKSNLFADPSAGPGYQSGLKLLHSHLDGSEKEKMDGTRSLP
jgi:hypothetical protein